MLKTKIGRRVVFLLIVLVGGLAWAQTWDDTEDIEPGERLVHIVFTAKARDQGKKVRIDIDGKIDKMVIDHDDKRDGHVIYGAARPLHDAWAHMFVRADSPAASLIECRVFMGKRDITFSATVIVPGQRYDCYAFVPA